MINSTRTYSKYAATPQQQELVEGLLHSSSTQEYRQTMKAIGKVLAQSLAPLLPEPSQADLRVICTVEDADFLASGLLDELELLKGFSVDNLHLSCLWNERVRRDGVSISPIVKSYIEPKTNKYVVFIVIKSIISGACVVRTNLLDAISRENPQKVFVVAPVIYEGAEQRLANEFPAEVSALFDYVYFASDSERTPAGIVKPGIGGQVYELLGLGENSREKNNYLPQLVQTRRELIF